MNPHRKIVSKVKCLISLCAVPALLGVMLLPSNASAQNIIMQDEGSTATINPGTGTGNLGMNYWGVDTVNQNQLNQQWFWYSVNGGVAQTIDTLGGMSVASSSGSDGINDVLTSYQNGQLFISIEYVLTGNGSGSGSADLTESIVVKNIGNTAINNFSFFQYSDFNLLGGNNDSVNITGSPGSFSSAVQTTATGGAGIAEVIEAPNANYAEANFTTPVNSSTLYKLNNTAGLTLDNNQNAGPGNVTWALQWTQSTLNPNQMMDIFKDKGLSIQLVPEPSTLALIALGMGALGLSLRRKSA